MLAFLPPEPQQVAIVVRLDIEDCKALDEMARECGIPAQDLAASLLCNLLADDAVAHGADYRPQPRRIP